jgi:Protein of unknown function (DUF4242)
MPRYLIARAFDPDLEDGMLDEIGRRSRRLATEKFPGITWEHSHVVTDADGNALSFCVYDAPNETIVREHAALLGFHEVLNIYEIGGDISPQDFPL